VLLEQIVRVRFCSLKGVVSAYLVHGRATGELFPGLSDFDLILIFCPSKNPDFVRELRVVWNKVRQLLPVRDVSPMTENDFLSWQRFGSGLDPLDELPHWIHFSGKDLRIADSLNLASSVAEQDRQRYAFASYNTLLRCALKDEANINFLLIRLRRQIYKSFCSSVLNLNKDYLLIRQQKERLLKWAQECSFPKLASRLIELQKSRFFKGEVSRLSFEAAASAYMELDKSANIRQSFGCNDFELTESKNAIFNEQEIIVRAQRIVNEITRHLTERFRALYIVSNGSARGYALYVILHDGLTLEQISECMRHVHEIFRLFDDPWFNEHYPAAVPIICSQAMFRRSLELWSFYASYWQKHPIVLYGEDFHLEKHAADKSDQKLIDALEAKRSALSRYYRQTTIEASRPAFFDFVTLHLPRYLLQLQGLDSSTSEESIIGIEKSNSTLAAFARNVFYTYEKHDIDAILRDLPLSLFVENKQMLESLIDLPVQEQR
jgi:hypothetical protein